MDKKARIDFSNYPIIFDAPERLTDITSWHGHIPFAFFIVQALKPACFVELGTHRGDSYCAVCQAVDTLGIACRCHAVDRWKGDAQAGFYNDDVLDELKRYHDARYGPFSTLIQKSFNDAVMDFPDGSIDLLHVDGFHRYEVVKHDVMTWLPKMSARGVMLIHDTQVTEGDFGVWKLWEELSNGYETFEFIHSHGLGILRAGDDVTGDIQRLLESDNYYRRFIQHFFAALGENIVNRRQVQELTTSVTTLQNMATVHRRMIESKDAIIEKLEREGNTTSEEQG